MTFRSAMHPYSGEIRARAVALYLGGESFVDVAKALGIGRDTVRRWALEDGTIALRGRPRCPPDMRVRALAMRAAGMLQREIGAELGVSQVTVSKWLMEAGLRPPRSPRPKPAAPAATVAPAPLPDTRDLTARLMGDPPPGRRMSESCDDRRPRITIPARVSFLDSEAR